MPDRFPTVPPPPQRLLVFASLPEHGKVKKRLAADLGDTRALAIYESMLRTLIESIGAPTRTTDIEFLWPPTTSANGELIRRAFADHAAAMQTGPTLGDRLCMAFSERFFFHRTQKIIAIGTDDPTLPRDLIDHAFALLDSCEFVVGPAAGGRYYLFGCRALSFDPEVFADVHWGTRAVLKETVDRIAATSRTMAMLPERLDIDTADDLERYARATGWQP